MLDTRPLLETTDFPRIFRGQLSILQVNLGYLCNLSCVHCHVNAGPKRKELMTRETIDQVLAFIDKQGIKVLDLTGGAPEMNPDFRYLVVEARKRGVEVIDRCNLTILNEPGYEDLAQFLTDQRVIITASLPCYSEQNVEKQRGKGVFAESIAALQKLNALGYGMEGSGLQLNLVYNPGGPFLPPDQETLRADYQRELKQAYDVEFNDLLTITNMPISRFGSMLLSKGQFEGYMRLLKDSFSKENLAGLMCKSLISVDWQGEVYDCDFNQQLDMKVADKSTQHINNFDLKKLESRHILINQHCYGCTAGAGSSCQGTVA